MALVLILPGVLSILNQPEFNKCESATVRVLVPGTPSLSGNLIILKKSSLFSELMALDEFK